MPDNVPGTGSDIVRHIHGTTVLLAAADGEPVRDGGAALEFIGAAGQHDADWVVVPASRFADDFFQLRTRVAGDFLQKFATYRSRIAILGDISRHTAASASLQALVRECNRGTDIWFVADLAELEQRFAARAVDR